MFFMFWAVVTEAVIDQQGLPYRKDTLKTNLQIFLISICTSTFLIQPEKRKMERFQHSIGKMFPTCMLGDKKYKQQLEGQQL